MRRVLPSGTLKRPIRIRCINHFYTFRFHACQLTMDRARFSDSASMSFLRFLMFRALLSAEAFRVAHVAQISKVSHDPSTRPTIFGVAVRADSPLHICRLPQTATMSGWRPRLMRSSWHAECSLWVVKPGVRREGGIPQCPSHCRAHLIDAKRNAS